MCDDMAFFYFFNSDQKLEISVVNSESKSKSNPATEWFGVQDAAVTAIAEPADRFAVQDDAAIAMLSQRTNATDYPKRPSNSAGWG